MALDNIQKSIFAVLAISGMAALLTPTNMVQPTNNEAAVTIDDQTKSDLAPPTPEELPAEQEAQSSSNDAVPAFGEPTISGLPFGQEPAKNNNPETTEVNRNVANTSDQNNGSPEVLAEGTVLESGGVVKDGKVVY